MPVFPSTLLGSRPWAAMDIYIVISINQSILLLECTVLIGTRAWIGPVQHLQHSSKMER